MAPAVSERQRKFMGAELGRKRAGKQTKTKMSEKQLEEFASKPNPKQRIKAKIAKMKQRRNMY